MTCAMRHAKASTYATQGCAISGPAMYLTTRSWAKIQRRRAKFKTHHIGLIAHITRAYVQVRCTLWSPLVFAFKECSSLYTTLSFVIPPMWDKMTNLNPFFSSLFFQTYNFKLRYLIHLSSIWT